MNLDNESIDIFMNILDEAKEYSLALLLDEGCDKLPFHNVQHTLEVFKRAYYIASQIGLDSEELEMLLLAAIFHDVGQVDGYLDHENRSAQIASDFLNRVDYDTEKIDKVVSIIKATKMPQKPNNILEQIICDADLYHLGTADFFTWNAALRNEWKLLFGKNYSDSEWLHLNVQFLKEHHYHTAYCQKELNYQKHKNVLRLENSLKIN